MSIITKLPIELPEEAKGINEKTFLNYLAWDRGKKEIEKRIIKRFEENVLSFSPFNDYNIPKEIRKIPIYVGNEIEFEITAKPTTKRPSYKSILNNFMSFIDFLLFQYSSGIRRKGVITMNDEPYILLDYLDKEFRNMSKSRIKKGVEHKLSMKKPQNIVKHIPSNMLIDYERDYSKVTDYNSRTYNLAKNFIEEGSKRSRKFKKLLLSDSLQTIGKEPETIETVSYPFENFVFLHQLEPRSIIKYKDVIRKLESDLKKPESMSIIRNDRTYISLKKLKKRIDEYIKQSTTKTKEQNILLLPKY